MAPVVLGVEVVEMEEPEPVVTKRFYVRNTLIC